jgi:hypothetical protein
MSHNALLVHVTLALLGLLGENVTLERFLEGDFAGAGDLKPLFGARIGFYLWHFECFLHDTLLADPHRRNTYGAVWAKPVRSGRFFPERKGRL